MEQTLYWKKKDGTRINLRDMTEDHIISTMNMIKKTHSKQPLRFDLLDWLSAFQNELDLRNETPVSDYQNYLSE